MTKKERAVIERERRKIFRNLEGIRNMTRLPGALIILDVRREHIAVKEARKLNIPTICLVDTDSDPTTADVIIPGNDDAMRAIELIVTELAEAVEEGKRSRPPETPPEAGEAAPTDKSRPRRSRRLTTSQIAEEGAAEPDVPIENPPSSDLRMEALAAPAAPVIDSTGSV